VRKAFVIGSQGLVDELALVGVESVGGADPAYAARIFHSEAEFLEVRFGLVISTTSYPNQPIQTRSIH
jgi:hypothetical protein